VKRKSSGKSLCFDPIDSSAYNVIIQERGSRLISVVALTTADEYKSSYKSLKVDPNLCLAYNVISETRGREQNFFSGRCSFYIKKHEKKFLG